MVVLTGGDPFERPDLAELVAYGTEAGLHVSLSPSVTPRLTAPTLAEMKDAGAHVVSLSIDGATAATHDAFRGIDGTFDATLAAAATVHESGLRLQLNSTVTAGNVTELPALLDLVVELDPVLWSVFFLVPTGRGSALRPLPAADIEQVLWWLHEIAHVVPVKTTEAPHFRRVAIQRAEHPGWDGPGGALLDDLRQQTRPHPPRRQSTPGRVPTTAGRQRRPRLLVHRPPRVGPAERLPAGHGRVVARPAVLDDLPRGPAPAGIARPRRPRRQVRGVRVPGGVRRLALPRLRGDRRPARRRPECAYEPAGASVGAGASR